MRRSFGLGLLMALTVVVMVSGCGSLTGTASEPAAPPPAVAADEVGVYAEGVVVPARSVTLQAPMAGTIAAVTAEEGSAVAAGVLIVQIDPTDGEIAVDQAEAGLAAADAQLAVAEAGTREEQIAVLMAQLEAANAAVAQAAAARDAAAAGLDKADVADAQADVLEAQLSHASAADAHGDTMECYTFGDQEVCPTLGTLEELTRAQEEAAYAGLLAAQAQLEMTETQIAPRVEAAQADVQAALATRDAVAAQLALAEAGAREEQIAVAEAGVAQATAAVAQAQELVSLHRVDVPFAATVTDLSVKPGDTVAAGAPLATVATLDRLQIKTVDLTELDVGSIVAGHPVRVTFDAMPDQILDGTVVRIEPQGALQFGDVLYTVVVELDATPDWLRWGMTAQVEIEAVGQ